MECNKEEAIRAKVIAERKMQSNDFEGARKFALKAKNLYPELDNVTQMLSICDVYCSAQIKLPGLEKDWYGVLQVEKLANESTIKKQYRKLALVLHPDKNRFPSAEGAFKLICEANAVLSDPEKKTLYDNKIKVLAKTAAANPPNHQGNRNYQQYGAQNNSTYYGFSSQNTQSSSFWTGCPYCNCRVQYSRQFIGLILQCSQCLKPYAALESSAPRDPSANMGHQGVPSKPNICQPNVFQEKVGTNRASSEIGVKNVKVPSTSHAGSQGTANVKSVKPQPGAAQKRGGSESVNIASAAENLKTKETVFNASPSRGKKAHAISNGDADCKESRNTRAKRQNRRRKVVLESSDDSDANIEDTTEQENLAAAADLKSKLARKSSRRRHHVSYKEPDEDDCARSVKRAHTTKKANGKEHKDAGDGEDSKRSFPTVPCSSKSGNKEMGAAHSKESVKDKNEDKKGEIRGVTGGRSSAPADDTVEIESDSDLDFSLSEDSERYLHECPDPEFSNFDKLREESQFHKNQFWAFYDTTSESMPRFYGKVRKVCSSPFELSITWLEAVPIDESWEKWVDEELPVGCGSFKLGQPEEVSGCLSLSHQVHCEKGKKRGSLFIYPRKGEVWALYRDWDISWSSNPNPEKHKKFRYELVEVLSDFAAGVGINVGYLDKVTGFVSLFQRVVTSSFFIKPTEVYRFSHCVPSFKMTGTERAGVPIGSFELDPASLPINPDDLFFPCAKMESRAQESGVGSSPPKYGVRKGKYMASGSTHSPHKIVDLEATGGDVSNLRRSPRVGKTN